MATPRTTEDGVPRKLPPEVVRVRGSRGKQNPQISEGQLRKTVNQDLSKTRAPASPGPFKAKGPLEEVKVKAPRLQYDKHMQRMLKGLLGSRGFTNISNAYLGQYIWNKLTQQIEQVEREQFEQDAEAYAEEEDAIATGVAHTGYEEVVVTAPMFGAVPQNSTWTNPYGIYSLSTWAQRQAQLKRMEHVNVYAPRITDKGTVIREVEYTWEYIRQRVPTSPYISPRHAPGRYTNTPVGDPNKHQEPPADPFPRIDKSKVTQIQGQIITRITPNGVRVTTMRSVSQNDLLCRLLVRRLNGKRL